MLISVQEVNNFLGVEVEIELFKVPEATEKDMEKGDKGRALCVYRAHPANSVPVPVVTRQCRRPAFLADGKHSLMTLRYPTLRQHYVILFAKLA